jgi:hypothetical protein
MNPSIDAVCRQKHAVPKCTVHSGCAPFFDRKCYFTAELGNPDSLPQIYAGQAARVALAVDA